MSKKKETKQSLVCISTTDPELWAKVKQMAKWQKRSLSNLIQYIVGKYLDQLEEDTDFEKNAGWRG